MTEAKSQQIGDLSSQERGSGTRLNGGKPPLELIPIRVMVESWGSDLGNNLRVAGMALARFQEGGDAADLHDAIRFIGNQWDECAHVFDYGRKKYAEWNWAKGMSWNAVIGCAARHWRAIALGHHIDDESGLTHRGHILCNMVMLLTYLRTYRDGDDRPVAWLCADRGPAVPYVGEDRRKAPRSTLGMFGPVGRGY